MAKDIDTIVEALDEQGWRIIRKGGKRMAYPPDKTKPAVLLPDTPGGGRWRPNLIAQLRRSGFVWPPKKER